MTIYTSYVLLNSICSRVRKKSSLVTLPSPHIYSSTLVSTTARGLLWAFPSLSEHKRQGGPPVLRFGCEMPHIGSWVWTLAFLLTALLGEALEPLEGEQCRPLQAGLEIYKLPAWSSWSAEMWASCCQKPLLPAAAHQHVIEMPTFPSMMDLNPTYHEPK